jgi:hypothetical protein
MPYERNQFIRISELSQMGSCETKFVKAISGTLFPTKAMQIGSIMHEDLAKSQPKMTQEEIIENISKREEFEAVELPIKDYKLMLSGRIDSLYFTGKVHMGRNECIVIDSKYSRVPHRMIPTYYMIQLVAYTMTVEHSNMYGSTCFVAGVRLVSREKETHNITGSVEAGRDVIDSCESHMQELLNRARELVKGEQPKHVLFDIFKGEWRECYCRNG